MGLGPSRDGLGNVTLRPCVYAFVGYIALTLVGCGQTPQSSVESSKNSVDSASKPVEIAANEPVVVTKESSANFLDEFHLLQKEFDDQIQKIGEKIEKQFLDPNATDEDQDRLRKQYNSECRAVTAPMIPRVFEVVKPHLTEILAVKPLMWLAENDRKSSTGLDATKTLFEVVKSHVTDNAAVEPLIWFVTEKANSNIGKEAMELLKEHHLTNPTTIEMAIGYKYSDMPWAEPTLRALISAATLPEDQRPRLMYALALRLSSFAKKENSSKELDEAIQLYTEIQQKYANTESQRGMKFGDLAASALFEIQNLAVGQQAPEIEGEDLEGVPFKLSDYRGKVVMLSFWASWCGPCMALVPRERELVKRYEGRPFVLIGVNGDMNKETVMPLLGKDNICWRSFWAGDKGPNGPLPVKWNVQGWPTVYVIDHVGVIKLKTLEDATIEELVSAAEKSVR